MKLDQKLVDAAIAFTQARYAIGEEAGAAAMYTSSGKILVSTFFDSPNDAVRLCHETGAICEAHKLGEVVTASVCVNRLSDGRFHILSPCGICQERLYLWGGAVEVAVPVAGDPTRWVSKTLAEVQPYYWYTPYKTNNNA